MAISLNVTRPKLQTTNSVDIEVVPGSVTVNDNNIELTVEIKELQGNPSPPLNCTYNDTTAEITLVNNTGQPITNYIRVGDTIAGDMDAFPLGTEYVTAISTSGNNVTLTINVVPAQAGNNVALTFTPEPVDSVFYILQLGHTTNANSIVVTPKLYSFDGSKVRDADANGKDDSNILDASAVRTLPTHTLNVDTFLNNARVSRTN